MKKQLSLALMLCFAAFSYAQFNQDAPWMANLNAESRTSTNPIKFQDQVNAFNTYWETRDPNVKGSGYKPFKRWETHWANFVKEDGTLPTSLELWNTYLEVKGQANARNSSVMVDESNWLPVGPFSHTNTGSWSSGQGRVNVVVPDPITPTTLYAGAPAGGLWKSLDNGVTWATTTDALPQIGVSGIAVDANNTDIIYIATGDDDAGDSFSVGVMKSTDGGQTWNTTGLNPGNSPSSMNDIYIDPVNSNTLWVATNNGIYKTTDAGVTWNNNNGTQGQNMRDIKLRPGDSNIVYGVTSNRFWKSFDGGDSFTQTNSSTFGLPLSNISRYVLDVTPANPNLVYLLAANNNSGFLGVYKSTNNGLIFNQVASPAANGDIFQSSQAWFDLAFAVSDTDENEIYTGVLNIWKGNVSGNSTSFTQVNNWSAPFSASYSHADIHYLRFFNGDLYAGTDGGFYRSSNGGTSFTDLTGGMQISQFYRISVSKQTSDKMVGGLQDNGGHAYNNGQWQNYYGADGMDTAIDPANSDLYYGFTQNGGGLYISSTAGASSTGNVGAPEGGNWITPLFMASNSQLYSGYSSLYRLENNNWTQVSPSFGTNIDVLEIDDIDPNNIYVATNNQLQKSINGGTFFTLTESFSSNITSIEVNNSNNDIVYVTTSGGGGQVFQSIDGGNNFTNISAGLPNVTKNSIKHQSLHSKNPLFLGTSLGVYRYDDDTLTWELFNIGLPNVTVTDLEINVVDNKITAATYGRGIWQSEIPTELAPTDVKLVAVTGISSDINCNADVTPVVEIENNGLSTITSVDFDYLIDGVNNLYTWTGSLVSEATISVPLPQFTLAKGQHTFEVSSTTANDAYAVNNNSPESIILTNGQGVVQVVNTFETPQEELLVYDEGVDTQYWERGIPTGTLLNNPGTNPTNQVYGTNLAGDYVANVRSYLLSDCYDLTQLSDPEIKFDMAFDLELDWDIVYVQYSTDLGNTWTLLGTSADPNWYNSNTPQGQNNTCLNCPGQQWTGTNATLTEYTYDLTALNTETSIMFRIVFHSDGFVNQEGAIVDGFVIRGNVLSTEEFETQNFLVYPNPSRGLFNIKTKAALQFNASVFDVTGKVIFTENNIKTVNNSYQLDLSGYSTGVYFLNLETDSSKITKKLIVN